MQNLTKLGAAFASAALTFTLAACAGEDMNHDAHAEQTAANGDVFNDADVDFATAMIPHHAQALAMVDLTQGRDLTPELQELTQDILEAQGPEIELMTGWLTDWDQPIPETMRDHVNSGHDMDDMDEDQMGDDSTDMPGMMTAEEMAELEAASDAAFEDMWLEMMIEHHEGAIDMASTEQEDGAFTPAVNLAESIETSQQAEIDHMQELLAS